MLENVFGKKILDHYKNPRHKGKMKKVAFEASATNPVCGDCTYMQFDIKDGVIKDAMFDSLGCAVSIAAADILADEVIGKSVAEVKKLSREDLLGLLDTQLTEHKMECAGMSVDALKRAIKAYEKSR
jgi:SUF system NifU family Fe-S assembly protein